MITVDHIQSHVGDIVMMTPVGGSWGSGKIYRIDGECVDISSILFANRLHPIKRENTLFVLPRIDEVGFDFDQYDVTFIVYRGINPPHHAITCWYIPEERTYVPPSD